MAGNRGVTLHLFIQTQWNKTFSQPRRCIREQCVHMFQVGADRLFQKAIGIRMLPPFTKVGRTGVDSFGTLLPVGTDSTKDQRLLNVWR